MTPSGDETISVVIPCHGHASLLAGAIESALGQDVPGLEVIVVNDGSPDATSDVARQCAARAGADRVRLVEQPQHGQAWARQAGLNAARGNFIVQLDADDRLEPGMAARCLAAFRADPALDVAVGDAWLVDDADQKLKVFKQARATRWPDVLEMNPYGALAGTMARVASVRAAGGLGLDGAPGCEDWDLWARMARCGMRFGPVAGEPVARYRQSAGGYSRRAERMLASAIGVLDRCRAEDARLAASPSPPAPPIDAAMHARLRGAMAMFFVGVAVAAPRPEAEACARMLATLLPGAPPDPALAKTRLAWGCHYGLQGAAQDARPVLPDDPAWPSRLAEMIRQSLECIGWPAAAARSVAAHAERLARDPRRPAPLAGRLARRVGGWLRRAGGA